VQFPKVDDYAIYNADGARIKVMRNTNEVNLDEFKKGTYYIVSSSDESYSVTLK